MKHTPKPYKLTIATLGEEQDLRTILAGLGSPIQLVQKETKDGTLFLFNYIFETLMEAQVYDRAARIYLDNAGIRPDYDAHIVTFASETTYEPIVL